MKIGVATGIAILFHVIGVVGILMNKDVFAALSSLNLALMFLLVLFTQKNINGKFLAFLVCCYIIGMISEFVGTKTGILFGNYTYGHVLGPSVWGVPLIIGINWFLVIYCSGITMSSLLSKAIIKKDEPNKKFKTLSLVIDGALLVVLFDWLLEPVAVKLGYWQWKGEIPVWNYLSWFVLGIVLLSIFRLFNFNKVNGFAVNLLLIQMMFFLVLRTFL